MVLRYSVAFFGKRDYYQLPAALSDQGKLDFLYTDWYAPDWTNRIPNLSLVPPIAKMLDRKNQLLPSSQTRSVGCFQVAELRTKRWFQSRQAWSYTSADAWLGRYTERQARRRNTGCILYSYHLPGFAEALSSPWPSHLPLVVFQPHPPAWQVQRILSELAEAEEPQYRQEQEELLTEPQLQTLRNTYSLPDAFIVPSTFVKVGLLEAGVASSQIHIVPYGSNLENETCTDNSSHVARTDPCEPLRLLFVGQLTMRKGLASLSEALRLLPAHTATLTVVTRGIPDPQVRSHIPDDAIVLTDVSNEALGQLYDSHHVFVMPSLLEGFGLVYIEAMSRGLPVIGTANSACPDLYLNGKEGYIVKPNSPEQLAELIMNLAGNRVRLAEMSAAAKETASQFTWRRFRQNILQAITAIEAEHHDTRGNQ